MPMLLRASSYPAVTKAQGPKQTDGPLIGIVFGKDLINQVFLL